MEIIFNTMTVAFSVLFAISIWAVIGVIVIKLCDIEGMSKNNPIQTIILCMSFPVILVSFGLDKIEYYIGKL